MLVPLQVKLIAAGVIVIGAIIGVKSYGYSEYKRGYKEMEVKYEACQESFKTEVSRWNAEVERQKKELKDFELSKKDVVKRNWDVFNTTKKKVTKLEKATTDEIKASIKPTDVVIVPRAFASVYNHAVEGSRVATGNQGGTEIPDYSVGAAGQTATIDATYFTQVMKNNVDSFNQLAAQCVKLIDIVIDLEANYGNYVKGSVSEVSDTGGNVPAGVAGN